MSFAIISFLVLAGWTLWRDRFTRFSLGWLIDGIFEEPHLIFKRKNALFKCRLIRLWLQYWCLLHYYVIRLWWEGFSDGLWIIFHGDD
jgi:hypothetical protein